MPKLLLTRVHVRALVAFSLLGAPAAIADPPTPPPAGPISKSYKTLDQVRPGTPISSLLSSAEAVAVVSAAGHYYLDRDMVVPAGKSGIVLSIPANTLKPSVSFDLGSYSITGTPGGGSSGGSGSISALSLQPLGGNIIIHGSSATISGFGGDGINVQGADNLSIDGLSIQDCGGAACTGVFDPSKWQKFSCSNISIDRIGGQGLHIEDASSVDLRSLILHGTASDACNVRAPATLNRPHVIILTAATISQSGGQGVVASGFSEITLRDVSASRCVSHGVRLEVHAPDGVTDTTLALTDCHSTSNGGHGFFTVSPRDQYGNCRASANTGDGFHAVDPPSPPAAIAPKNVLKSFFECSSMGNGGSGFFTITPRDRYGNCQSSANTGDGFHSACEAIETRDTLKTFRECSSTSNTGSGFDLAGTAHAKNVGVFTSSVAGQNTRAGLKEHFTNGDIPNQPQFVSLIDSVMSHNGDDGCDLTDTCVSIKGGDFSDNGASGLRTRLNQIETKLINIGLLNTPVRRNGGSGIDIVGGSLDVRDCTIAANGAGPAGGDGLKGYLLGDTAIHNSAIYESSGHGISIDHSGHLSIVGGSMSRNGSGPAGGHGLHADTCTGVSLQSCSAHGNHADGWNLLQCDSVKIGGSTSSDNGGAGLSCSNANLAALLSGNVVIGNGLASTPGSTGASGAVFTNCRAVTIDGGEFSGNGLDGLTIGINQPLPYATLHVRSARTGRNPQTGMTITASGGSTGAGFSSVSIRDCDSSSNGQYGISCDAGVSHTLLEGNTCDSNGGAIFVAGPGNTLRNNTGTAGALGGFSVLMPGNTMGPVVDGASLSTDCNKHSNLLH